MAPGQAQWQPLAASGRGGVFCWFLLSQGVASVPRSALPGFGNFSLFRLRSQRVFEAAQEMEFCSVQPTATSLSNSSRMMQQEGDDGCRPRLEPTLRWPPPLNDLVGGKQWR